MDTKISRRTALRLATAGAVAGPFAITPAAAAAMDRPVIGLVALTPPAPADFADPVAFLHYLAEGALPMVPAPHDAATQRAAFRGEDESDGVYRAAVSTLGTITIEAVDHQSHWAMLIVLEADLSRGSMMTILGQPPFAALNVTIGLFLWYRRFGQYAG